MTEATATPTLVPSPSPSLPLPVPGNDVVTAPAPARPILVGNEFIKFYYSMMGKSLKNMHRFYMKTSTYKHGKLPEAMGQKSIHECIMGLNLQNSTIRINYIDAQESIERDILVQTGGTISFDNNSDERPFTQMFVLSAQTTNKFVVLNDVFVYEDEYMVNESDIDTTYDTDVQLCEIRTSETTQKSQIAEPFVINVSTTLSDVPLDDQNCSNIAFASGFEITESESVDVQSAVPNVTISLTEPVDKGPLSDLAEIEALLLKDNVDQIWFFDRETSEDNFQESNNDAATQEKVEEKIQIIEQAEPIQIPSIADNENNNVDNIITATKQKTTNVESKLINVPTTFPQVRQAWNVPLVSFPPMQNADENDGSGYTGPKSMFHQSSRYLEEYPPVNVRSKIKKTYIPPPITPNIDDEYGRCSHYYVRTKMSRETILRLIEDQLVNGTHKQSKRYKKFRMGVEAKKLGKLKEQEESKTTTSKTKKKKNYKMKSLLTNLHISNVDFGLNSTILVSDEQQCFNNNNLIESTNVMGESKAIIASEENNTPEKKNKTNKRKKFNKNVNTTTPPNGTVDTKDDDSKSINDVIQSTDDKPKPLKQFTPRKSMSKTEKFVDARTVNKDIGKSASKTNTHSTPTPKSDNNSKRKMVSFNESETYASRLHNGGYEHSNKNYNTNQNQPKKSIYKTQKSYGNEADKQKTGNTDNKDNNRNTRDRSRRAYKPNQIFVGRVPTSATKDILISVFSSYGEISEIALFKANSPTVPNYCFITYKNQEDMYNCLSKRPIMLPINANSNHRLNVEVRKRPTYDSPSNEQPIKASATTKTRVFYNKNFK
ncbi:peroxisome proliferator-activated receptor gamma coactivator 1-alpha-like isoform X2 [Teleopsis dalmanni]|uniref:peroxisome proliferator-activated receptor gamma coactivator 1-alpha-like isoform X2 n=1 Tax=Teleopsis dalmanni TaxID=139649 RepID=UPI0018CD5884|nr:peroxisome proliferator-activated receptor gamma coactivator 1-alpha-like isoform X2 [Teleopsis dalmanni]